MSYKPVSNVDHFHKIEITNFHSGECVKYRIVLLKGTIIRCCEENHVSFIVSSGKSVDEFPCTDLDRKQHTGSFKHLVCLIPGENDIRVTYCQTYFTFRLIFHEPENPYIVKIYYVICTGCDGRFQSDSSDNSIETACNKINVGMHLIQCLIAEKLLEAGFTRKTFQLRPCIPFKSTLTESEALSMPSNDLWTHLAKEFIAADRNDENTKYVGFLSWAQFMGIKDADKCKIESDSIDSNEQVALGGGDVAIFGTGCLYTWPSNIGNVLQCFKNEKRVNVSKLMDDSNSRQTYGGCFSTTLGSVCHEIGHIFNLSHSQGGIMGTDMDHFNRFFKYEHLTVSLPKRTFGQGNNSDAIAGQKNKRLTQVKRQNAFLDSYRAQRDNDLTFFKEHSAITLFYHKWFNDVKPPTKCFLLDGCTVITLWPIRLIEIREPMYSVVTEYFSFLHEHIFEFKLPNQKQYYNNDLTIFVIDDNGNTFTSKI